MQRGIVRWQITTVKGSCAEHGKKPNRCGHCIAGGSFLRPPLPAYFFNWHAKDGGK